MVLAGFAHNSVVDV